MSDIIGVIAKVEDDSYGGKDFKVVTLETGQALKVKHGRDDALKAKWGLLQKDLAVRFIMRDFTTPDGVKIPFVFDIESVADSLPPPKEPVTPHVPEKVTPPDDRNARIEYQVALKEIGELYRTGFLEESKPVDKKLIASYYTWLCKTMDIEVT